MLHVLVRQDYHNDIYSIITIVFASLSFWPVFLLGRESEAEPAGHGTRGLSPTSGEPDLLSRSCWPGSARGWPALLAAPLAAQPAWPPRYASSNGRARGGRNERQV